jgi:hypothetical protein
MQHGPKHSWWGLYLFAAVIAALLYADSRARLSPAIHTLVLIAIIVGAASLAWSWSESHADLLGSQGIDAKAEAYALADQGVDTHDLAPSLTARQAGYRQVMLAHLAHDPDAQRPAADHWS